MRRHLNASANARLRTPSWRRLAFSGAAALLWSALAIGCVFDSPERSAPGGEPIGGVRVSVSLQRVGGLAKPAAIEMGELQLVLSASGETTLRDTIALEGHDQQSVIREFDELAAWKTWSLVAVAKDTAGVVVYADSTTFTLEPGESKNLPLSLAARYSMLTARFFPIRDSVTSVALFVENQPIADSGFAKQSLVGDTVALEWDYLPASISGTLSHVRLDARGDYFGQSNVLLYRGEDSIMGFSGRDTLYRITMLWMHPSPPPGGQAVIQVVVGASGTTTVEGELEEHEPPVDEPGDSAYTWSPIGAASLPLTETEGLAIVLDTSGHPIVAYTDWANAGKITVIRWNGTTWQTVGAAGFSPEFSVNPSVALDAQGNPVVAFVDESSFSDALTVMRWTGTEWQVVGTPQIGTSAFDDEPSLAVDAAGNLVVAYRDAANADKLTVLRWNGTAWTALGGAGVSDGAIHRATVALDSLGNPFVSYLDIANGNKPTVLRWNGTSWSSVGAEGFTAAAVSGVTLALDPSGHPVVAFGDLAHSNKISVLRWTGSAWAPVGAPGFTAQQAADFSMEVDPDGNPVVAFSDLSQLDKLTVLRWSGTAWVPLGTGVSTQKAYDVQVALDANGRPVVAARDGIENGNRLSVLRAVPSP